MAIETHNKHVNVLVDNLREVDRLQKIHFQITTRGPGRRHEVQVLHKSAIVLLVACWEAYVEDLVSAALEHMISVTKDHKIFPKEVLHLVALSHSGLKAWDLAGSGWKRALRGNLKHVLAKTTGKLNTPKTAQVDDLFNKVIGLKSISSKWHWRGRSAQQTTTALDTLVTLRGSIAHRVKTAQSVTLDRVRDSRSLVCRLAIKSHNRVCRFLESQLGKSPWGNVGFEKTK